MDDLIRVDLEAYRDFWFHQLLLATLLVVVGLVLEGPELWYEIISIIRRWCPMPKFTIPEKHPPDWVKLWAFIGWLLIVGGVAGEYVADSFLSRADGYVQKFDETLLKEATRQSSSANAKSAMAYARAAETEKQAAQENSRAAEALKSAEIARKSAEGFQLQIAQANGRAAEANERAEGERLARFKMLKELQPRRLSSEQKKQLADLLKDNPQAIFIGWCMNGADCMDFANDIGDGLKQAKWTPTFAARFSSTYGVQIGFSKDSESRLAAHWTERLRSALSKIGVDCKITSFDPTDRTIPGGFEKNVLYLTIENKPEPTGEQ